MLDHRGMASLGTPTDVGCSISILVGEFGIPACRACGGTDIDTVIQHDQTLSNVVLGWNTCSPIEFFFACLNRLAFRETFFLFFRFKETHLKHLHKIGLFTST